MLAYANQTEGEPEVWSCVCGDPDPSFWPCTAHGRPCDPVEGWQGYYYCGLCYAVVDGATGRIYPRLPRFTDRAEAAADLFAAAVLPP